MQTSSKNKMLTTISAGLKSFAFERMKASRAEAWVLMEREGFKPLTRARIYQILEQKGITPKA